MNKQFWILLFGLIAQLSFAQTQSPLYVSPEQMKWVDDKYNAMTLEEKVGQLFVVAAYSNRDAAHEAEIEKLIVEEKIGGLIFMQDQAVRQVELTNKWQKLSKIPLLIGMDAEWGLAMRLKDVNRFPWAMALGAIADNQLIFEMGKAIGEQANRMGVHFNFAPDVDVNTNPKNPIIGNRSFGSDVNNVAQKGIAYANGMKEMKVLASAKHFPGHGDTSQDSHKVLPLINHDLEYLKRVELAPFQQLIDAGVTSVMVSHLAVPALEPDVNLPATLSKKIITDLLKGEMGFQGIVITDALNMKGITNTFKPGELDLLAFEAGNDILLFSEAVKVGKEKIIAKINSGEISEERLAESVKKILMAKYFVGLNQIKSIDTQNVIEDLNKVQNTQLTYKLYENAITLLKNENQILPFQNLAQIKIAYVPLEEAEYDNYFQKLQFHVPVEMVKIASTNDVKKLKDFDYVIVGVHKSNETAYKSYKISDNSKSIIKAISQQNPTVLTIFASPYALIDLDVSATQSVIVAYQNLNHTQDIVAGLLFGSGDFKGKLPVDVNETWKFGNGIELQGIQRLGFASPDAMGMKVEVIEKVDRLAEEIVNNGVAPGMQIVAAKNGKVIYNKTFGYESTERKKKVSPTDIYDVASVTKVTSTLPLLMNEVNKGELQLEQTLGSMIPALNSTNKSSIKLKEVLAHQAGFPAWIGFYKESVNVQNARLYLDYYSRNQDEEHQIKVADRIYIINSIRDTIREDIYYAPLGAKKYEYSDLGFYLYQDYLENKYGKKLDVLVDEFLYQPLGLRYTTYNPLEKFSREQIIPTERDKTYRNQLIHGYVHDQGAAMLGGVAGHAGLFSTAQEMAIIMQMYLNGGTYGGKQFFQKETVNEFTKTQYSGGRRGAGFDKIPSSTNCKCPSDQSFGHYGFTGTMVWADPKHELVFVFLSNRVNPSVNNNTLANKKYRENIRQLFYDAIVN